MTRGLRVAPHLAVFSVGYVVFAYTAVPARIVDALGVSFAAFGGLMSAALAAFVLVQVPASRVVDRYPTTRVLLAGLLAHAALAVALDFAVSYRSLLALRFCWGAAGGFVLSVGATHVARLHDGAAATRQQGFYGAMLTLGGALGLVVAPSLGTALNAPGALLALPGIVLLWRHRGDETTAPAPRRARDDDRVLTNPVVLLAALCYVAIIGSYITLSTFATAYYADLGVAVGLNVLVLLVASLGRGAGGLAVAGGVGNASLVGGGTAAAALGFAALALAGGGVVALAVPPFAMLAVSVPFGAVFAVAAAATSREGPALAFVVAAGNVSALVLPAVTGAIRDATGGYRGAFVLLAALNVLAVVGALRLAGPRAGVASSGVES